MKYGIKHDNGTIQAVCEFENEMAEGFTQISESDYASFTSTLDDHILVRYDQKANALIINADAEAVLEQSKQKEGQRDRLRQLSIELDLSVRLQEDTTDLQAEFNNLAADYRAAPSG